MAAVSGVAVSVGTGTLAAGSVAFLAASASLVQAAWVDPEPSTGEWKEETYVPGINVGMGESSAFTIPSGNMEIYAKAGSNLKLTINASGGGASQTFTGEIATFTGEIASNTFWVTTTTTSQPARLLVGANILKSSVEKIYVNKSALNITSSYTGTSELQADFILGASAVSGGGRPALSNSALWIGTEGSATTVSTTGGLEVTENSRIALPSDNCVFVVKGNISGSGDLWLTGVSTQNTGGELRLLGGGKFEGRFGFENNAGTVSFGQDTEIGGLFGGAKSYIKDYGGNSIRLTINTVKGDANLSDVRGFSGAIYVVKKGGYKQTISKFAGSGIEVQEGTFALSGASSVGNKGVDVKGGTLQLDGSTSFAAAQINVESGANFNIIQNASASFGGGELNLRGTMNAAGDVNLGGSTLNIEGGTVNQTAGVFSMASGGAINLNGGTLNLATGSNFGGGTLNLKKGEIVLGGSISGIRDVLELVNGVTLTFAEGATLRVDSDDLRYDVDKEAGTIVGHVDIIKVNGGSLNGWEGLNIVGYDDIRFDNKTLSVGFTVNDVIVVEDKHNEAISWRDTYILEDGKIWRDGESSLAITSQNPVILITGENDHGKNREDYDTLFYQRTAVSVLIAEGSELVLRQGRNHYDGQFIKETQFLGSVSWTEGLRIFGSLVLQDKNVFGSGNVASIGSKAQVVVDWRNLNVDYWRYNERLRGDQFTYGGAEDGSWFTSPFVGNSANIPTGYTGELVVRTGVFVLREADSFSRVVVENGGQAYVWGGNTYSGNITISGFGLLNVQDLENAQGPVITEPKLSALKLGSNSTVNGNVTVNDTAGIHIWSGESATINGQLIGAGLGRFSLVHAGPAAGIATLNVNGKVSGIKSFTIDEAAVLNIYSDFDASYIDSATASSGRFNHVSGGGTMRFLGAVTGFNRITVAGSLTIDIAASTTSGSFGSDVANFTKDGAGLLIVDRDFDVSGKIDVNAGTLVFGTTAASDHLLSASAINLSKGATLYINHAPTATYNDKIHDLSDYTGTAFHADMSLSDATLVMGSGWNEANKMLNFSTLSVSGVSFLQWAAGGCQGFAFKKLTGNGLLYVSDFHSPADNTQLLYFDKVENYGGTLYTSVDYFNNLDGDGDYKRLIIGTVHQDQGVSGGISIGTDRDEAIFGDIDGYVRSSRFRKTGAGSFTIDRIAFDTDVWMNYEGELKLGKVKFANNTILHYTTADNDRVILSSGAGTDTDVVRLYIDILSLSVEQLAAGVNLGFDATNINVDALKKKLVIGGLGDDYTLYAQDGRLYLRSDQAVSLPWDRSWGVISMSYSPTQKQLDDRITKEALAPTSGDDFWAAKGTMLELGGTNSKYVQTSLTGTSITLVQLDGGTGSKYSTVLGGRYYDVDSSKANSEFPTYIKMVGGDYHLLVGGSVNANESLTGSGYTTIGGTHVQVESGEVDYIVGGNHLSSGSFYFTGNTHISVGDPEGQANAEKSPRLLGGIVGGNTYVNGGGDFTGNTDIHVYSVLANDKEAPAIGVPQAYEGSTNAFTLIVGGSAYVGYSDGAKGAITFEGDSRIAVDLSTYTGGSKTFGKGIVGGNAYLSNETETPDEWNTSFNGDSVITIIGKDGKNADVTFNGVIVGATYHNSAGAQRINFTGDTSISISRGVFTQAVAGGFYEGENADGGHTNALVGDTNVSLENGTFWRAVGGSYSMYQGGKLTHVGDSYLTINGSSFTPATEGDDARSIIAGGDYIVGAGGVVHTHSGSTNLKIVGGTFDGSIIAGGNYFSSSNGNVGAGSEITGGAALDFQKGTLTKGLVVGGSYLSDSAAYGSVTVEDGTLIALGTATISADSELGNIAVVAGNYLNVEGGSHTARIENGSQLSMKGGTVSGHIVGGSVVTSQANTLSTDFVDIKLSGGTVKDGNVYGGHYVGGKDSDAPTTTLGSLDAYSVDANGNRAIVDMVVRDGELITAEGGVAVTEENVITTGGITITVDGAKVQGDIIGGGHFSRGGNLDSPEDVQKQGAILVRLNKGTLEGNLYAAGELGAPDTVPDSTGHGVKLEAAPVVTSSTRVEVGSGMVFGAKSTVSGDYHLTDDYDKYNAFIIGKRTLAFTGATTYNTTDKTWSGVTFRDFDIVDVAKKGNVRLSASQFKGVDTGLTKTGEGTLTLGGEVQGHLFVQGGTLVFEKKQDLSGGLSFDLTGRVTNDKNSAFLQGKGGFSATDSRVAVDLKGDRDSVDFGTYYLASNWNNLQYTPESITTDTRIFTFSVVDNCLVVRVVENSDYDWLWRGDTHHARVKAYEWSDDSAANWNAHQMDPNTLKTPSGKNLRFTKSAEGTVKVGELVRPASIAVESGNYTFIQRSPNDEEGLEGIQTDSLTIGGFQQDAILDLRLPNTNINNIFLKEKGMLIVTDEFGITSSIQRPEYNSIVYFDGGEFFYGENFDRDISWQVSESSTDNIKVGVAENHVEADTVNWGKLYDSLVIDTWRYNNGISIALLRGIEKTGAGTLRLSWGDRMGCIFTTNELYTGDITVEEGKLEYLINGDTRRSRVANNVGPLLYFNGRVSVADGAELVFSPSRAQTMRFKGEFTGEGTIVIGRRPQDLADDPSLADTDPNLHWDKAWNTCPLQGHGGKLTQNIEAGTQLYAMNSDFAGTLVLEGMGDRESYDYVLVGGREGDRQEMLGFDYDGSRSLYQLGGARTTLVLAGRHITINGMISVHSAVHGAYQSDPGLCGTMNTNAEFLSSGIPPKYIRAGVVEVKEGTRTYIGGTCHDSETDQEGLRATAYHVWDDNLIFTGKITGSGTMAIAWGLNTPYVDDGGNQGHYGYYRQQLWGAVNEFEGWLVAGDLSSRRFEDESTSGANWRLLGASAAATASEASEVKANLGGCGSFTFEYTRDTVLSGKIGDVNYATTNYGNITSIINVGTGKIIIGNKNNTSTGLLMVRGGGIDLGDVNHYANWAGTVMNGDSPFTLVNGELAKPMQPVEGAKVNIRVETSSLGPTTVNAGGTLCSDLYEIIINKDGFLTGVYEDLIVSRDATKVKLVFSGNNVKTAYGAGNFMIELRYNKKFILEDENYFLMDFGVDSIVELLKQQAADPNAESWLHILSKGTLVIPEGRWDDLLADGGDGARLLSQLGVFVERIERGCIVVKAAAGNRAYLVTGDGNSDKHTVNQYDVLSQYLAVVVESGHTLRLELMGKPAAGTRDSKAGGAVVPNLIGGRNSTFEVINKNDNRGNVTVILDNTDAYNGSLDTTFEGDIKGDHYVDFVKTGSGTLTVGYHDNWNTSGGFSGDTLKIRQGAMTLQGATNDIGSITFDYDTAAAEDEKRGLTLLNGDTTTGNIIEDCSDDAPVYITMGNDATLTLTGKVRVWEYPQAEWKTQDDVWHNVVITRQSDQSTGYLTVKGHTLSLTNTEMTQLRGVHLALESADDGAARIEISRLKDASIASLNGDGTLHANVGGTLELTNEDDGVFTGTFSSAPGEDNTLHAAKGVGTLTLRNVSNPGNWSLNNDGKLVIDVSGKHSSIAESNSINLNELTLGAESTTTYLINSDNLTGKELTEMLTANKLTVGAGAHLTIDTVGDDLFSGDELTVARVGIGSNKDGLDVDTVGFAFILNKVKDVYIDPMGNLKISFTEVKENPFVSPNMHTNALQGAHMFWDAIADPNSRFFNVSAEERKDLRDMLDGLDRLQKTGNYEALHKALAGGAGASTAVLGPAFTQDLQRQLSAIRNRTTMMGADQGYAQTGGVAYHAWINAEGNYHKQADDGLAPGFTLNSWGGTVGMDADISERSTVGLALTAMYGSLTPSSPDKASGKLDTFYLSFFGKTARGRWMHTFVGSIGMASVKLNRTVDYSYGSYTTEGSTNGYAIGLMYELGYSIPMNMEASYAVQPVVNITLRHTTVSGYEESGSGAGLRVGDISQTIITLGAGVRAQAVVGENLYNRTSILEGRVLVKLDAGDTKGESETTLINGSTTTGNMVSAEVGAVGLEVGAGISIPMDNSNGSVFFDASAEVRSGYTNLNATIGYRVSF